MSPSRPSRPFTVLLDGMIRPWGITHEWVLEDQTVNWGPLTLTVPVATVAPKPKLGPEHEWLQEQLDCLPRIAELAERGHIKCFTTNEIEFETWGRPGVTGKATEFDLFRNVAIKKIPPAVGRSFLWPFNNGEWKERKDAFLDGIRNDRFLKLKEAIGSTHAADIFHLWSAEKAGLDCFLSADRKFINAVRNQKRVLIRVCVLSPSELCERFPHFRLRPRWIVQFLLFKLRSITNFFRKPDSVL